MAKKELNNREQAKLLREKAQGKQGKDKEVVNEAKNPKTKSKAKQEQE